jgi:hypothetical protein
MRESLWAILNLAGAIIVTAVAILYATELGLWRVVLWIAAVAFVASAIGLLLHSFVRRRNRDRVVERPLAYLGYLDSDLAPAIISAARYSAYGRCFAAQILVNSGHPIQQRYLFHRMAREVMDKILDGKLEVRGRKPGQMDYEIIPRTFWRSSSFYVVEDPFALWKIIICPTGIVQIEPDGTVAASDAAAVQRTAQLDYDSLLVDAYQFEKLWPKADAPVDKKRRQFLRKARRRNLDKEEIRRLS